jgi:hypothetical protein
LKGRLGVREYILAVCGPCEAHILQWICRKLHTIHPIITQRSESTQQLQGSS